MIPPTIENPKPVRGSRQKPPQGLPLPQVDLAAPVWFSDLVNGRQWPPERLYLRTRRILEQAAIRDGDLSRWLDVPVTINRMDGLEEAIVSLLCDTPPTAEMVPQEELIAVIELMASDMLTHGRALALWAMGKLMAVDMERVWPLGDIPGGWIMVLPGYSEQADIRWDIADVFVYAPTGPTSGVLTGVRRRWDNYNSSGDQRLMVRGQLQDVIAAYAPMPAVMTPPADRGPARRGWGKPLTPAMLPLLVELSRREGGFSHVLDVNEHPLFLGKVATTDINELGELVAGLLAAPGQDDKPTMELIQELSTAIRADDVFIAPNGIEIDGYTEWNGSMEGSQWYLDHLGQLFTEKTGLAPIEAADSGDTPSGVAFARRQARLVIATRRLYRVLHAALETLDLGLTWEFVDTLAAAAGDGDPTPTDPPELTSGS